MVQTTFFKFFVHYKTLRGQCQLNKNIFLIFLIFFVFLLTTVKKLNKKHKADNNKNLLLNTIINNNDNFK